jgi:hypothetical protein
LSNYDRHELKIIRRGVSIDKVITAYKHFGSFRKAGEVCGISKDTVDEVIKRYNVPRLVAVLPKKTSYNPRTHYSDFAKWHQAHVEDADLPHSLAEFAKRSGVNVNVVKCYFYRRRKDARKILANLPDLRKLNLQLQDIEGHVFDSSGLGDYHYAIDRYSQRAALQGKLGEVEVTVLIPSIDRFASRVRKLNASAG